MFAPLSLPSASCCSHAFGLTFRLGLLKASVLRIPVKASFAPMELFPHQPGIRIFNALPQLRSCSRQIPSPREVRHAIKESLQAGICRCFTALP